MGLAATEDIAISFFKNIIKTDRALNHQEILDYEVSIDTFMNLFKNDEYTVRILDCLNAEIIKTREAREKKNAQKEFMRLKKLEKERQPSKYNLSNKDNSVTPDGRELM